MDGAPLPWVSLLLLGAAHGINPAMGWLFAVGRGLHERDRRAVWRALGPLALGHAAAIAVAVMLAAMLGQVVPARWLRCVGGMRVSARELATWSFLMASVHGAGLMVLPLVLGAGGARSAAAMHHHHANSLGGDGGLLLADGLTVVDPTGVIASLIHAAGYLAATASLAVIVYEKVGLRILRRAWVNVNVVWAAALIGAGVMTLLS
jgi:hypothetical protein